MQNSRLAVGIGLLCGVAFWCPPTWAVESHESESQNPNAVDLLVIGIDGVSINMIEGLGAHGWIPNLKAIAEEGAMGDLQSIWPLRTPQVWTSAVTGKYPSQHGIWDHLSNTYFNPPEVRSKEKQRVTAAQRQAKALWQLLDDANISSLTVGWMASWPADNMKYGAVVAPVELMGDRRQTTIKGSFYGGATEGLVSPVGLTKTVEAMIVDPKQVSLAEVRKTFGNIPSKDDPLRALPYIDRYVYGLHWSLARARSVEAMTIKLAQQKKPKVVLSYFQCPDSLLHRFWIFHKGPEAIARRFKEHDIELQPGQAQKLHAAFGDIVKACYQDTDARVGRMLQALAGPQTTVVVVSDHGFGNAPIPHTLKGEPYSGDHLEEGIMMVRGPVVSRAMKGGRIEGASVLDLTPSFLHYLGRPVGADMAGKVLPMFRGEKEPNMIPSYEKVPQAKISYREGWPKRKHPPKSRKDNGPIGY